MDQGMVEAIARRAGLERALEEFPDDVIAAAISAAKVTERVRRSSSAPREPSLEPLSEQPLSEPLSESLSEPWPPMVVVRK